MPGDRSIRGHPIRSLVLEYFVYPRGRFHNAGVGLGLPGNKQPIRWGLTVGRVPLTGIKLACQTSADPWNSVFIYFPGVIFVIRPDPMRKYFPLGVGGFLRNFELKMENPVNFW